MRLTTHQEEANAAEVAINEFEIRLQDGLRIIYETSRNDGDTGEKAWRNIIASFLETITTCQQNGRFITPEYLLKCVNYDLVNGLQATDEDKANLCQDVMRACFFRMLEERCIPTEILLEQLREKMFQNFTKVKSN